MALDYEAIANDQARLARTAANSIRTLASLYPDPAHFIVELLQNAEDALRRRGPGWSGVRSVNFHLSAQMLRFGHYGEPFNAQDIESICSVGETTKELNDIGRFGIGFKAVYAFTDRPSIHSGDEDFAVENFVSPVAASPVERDPDETAILIPLKESEETSHAEITRGLEGLDGSLLLFLREIEEIRWTVDGGGAGHFLRESRVIAEGIRIVTVVGQSGAQPGHIGEWLIFSRPVNVNGGRFAGQVEIAFSVDGSEGSRCGRIQPIDESPLVVFFPTAVETNLGFLVQGPYRTTPSRDNVPRSDPWNQMVVEETAELLREALRWLRDQDLLDSPALCSLPIDPARFQETSMFRPLFNATKAALTSEDLLPRIDSGHISAPRARLARGQELRELFAPGQLAMLFGKNEDLFWLSGDITHDRMPGLRRYLMQELGVPELTPETVIPRLGKRFLEAQPDRWIMRLYEFLDGQPRLRERFEQLPLVRLEDGSHSSAYVNGQPQVFLRGSIETDFPLVRKEVSYSEVAQRFLKSLDLTTPDPVDDVVRNILPRYQAGEVGLGAAEYRTDIVRILRAFKTDSKTQREKLVSALRVTPFVKAMDAGSGVRDYFKPGDVYLASERLTALFSGVGGVMLVEDEDGVLKGEPVRELLEACGATRYLQPVKTACNLSQSKLAEIRRQAGLERSTWELPIADVSLRGLHALLAKFSALDAKERENRASLLWDALIDVERRGSQNFEVRYTWGYAKVNESVSIDAEFVRVLNDREWVPNERGGLSHPEEVRFDSLGWKPHPFLESKIRFKPPVIEQLAREVGIEAEVFDLLKKHNLTSAAEVRAWLGAREMTTGNGEEMESCADDAGMSFLDHMPEPTPPVRDPVGPEPSLERRDARGDSHGGSDRQDSTERDGGTAPETSLPGSGTKRRPGSVGGRPFISYLGTHPDGDGPDPDGLDQQARMNLEKRAIDFILEKEPGWQRMPADNPGYDLLETNRAGQPTRWCEVKAMTGGLEGRPVGMSRVQFECAREHGDAYWLYVVEQVGTDRARIVRIQDPAGKARTFTFDRGWLDVAEVDAEFEAREE